MTIPQPQRELTLLLENLGLHLSAVDIGELEIEETLSTRQFASLKKNLRRKGFELIVDKEAVLAEKIKNVIVQMIHFSDEVPLMKYSTYISAKLNTNYTYLSKIFSKIKKTTIEHFIIVQKIERVKQLLLQSELTLSEIALKLSYSSTAHVSAQFKKITGLTPSLFKKSKPRHLLPMELS